MRNYEFSKNQDRLTSNDFLRLVNKVWPGDYDITKTQQALERTFNMTAWDHEQLVGCVRLLSDGYFFSTVTEILVDPEYQGKGIGAQLMEMAWEQAPSSLGFGVQAGNEAFFEKLGFKRSLTFFEKRKNRNKSHS